MRFLVLPKADGWGSFWFGKPGTSESPVIFRRAANERGESNRWFLSLGEDGIVFENGHIKEYRTPMLALEDLEDKQGGQ